MSALAGSANAPHLSTALGVTMGDPAGIGPEIAIKAYAERGIYGLAPFAVYGDPALLHERAVRIGLDVPLAPLDDIGRASELFQVALPVVSVPLARPSVPGLPDAANGSAVIIAIERAVADVLAGRIAAVVTNPIAKRVLYDGGFTYPGHTEFLAALARRHRGDDVQPLMLLASPDLKVVPLTIHVPLRQVADLITASRIIATARSLIHALQRDFGLTQPRIAVAGLNPHAGENGALGREEIDIIAPAIAALRDEGLDVVGPLSADTMFHAAARRRYDAAIAMYHDQALIPAKTLSFDTGVNVTLGLPFVRTSPDHGTAFDIAENGIASPASLIEAMRMASDIAGSRSAYDMAHHEHGLGP